MINFLVGKYIIYQPGQYSRPQVTPSLSHDIKLRNCPSWNIAHIPRAGAASGLHRPSGCARYFIRDNSFVRYLEITSVIKAFGPSGPHALITGCYFCYHTVINHSGLTALVVDNSVITGITMVITFGLSYHLVDIQYYTTRSLISVLFLVWFYPYPTVQILISVWYADIQYDLRIQIGLPGSNRTHRESDLAPISEKWVRWPNVSF